MLVQTIEDIAAPAPHPASSTVAPTVYVPRQLCGCGHERDTHEHHRRGSDCGICGAARCRRFRRRTGRGARSPILSSAAR